MTRERDLLEKVISGDNRGDFFVSYDLYKEIYEFLAQPEQEPVAWMNDSGGCFLSDGNKYSENWTALYTEPPKQPESTAEAVMPNGVCVSNVYDAYEEGRKSVMSEQQAEAWIIVNKETGYRTQVSDLTPFLYHKEIFEVIPLYTAPPVKSEQEHVGIVRTIGGYPDNSEHVVDWVCKYRDLKEGDKLYAAPSKLEPLSEAAVGNLLMCGFSTHLIDLVRMIEKAHGIGGGE